MALTFLGFMFNVCAFVFSKNVSSALFTPRLTVHTFDHEHDTNACRLASPRAGFGGWLVMHPATMLLLETRLATSDRVRGPADIAAIVERKQRLVNREKVPLAVKELRLVAPAEQEAYFGGLGYSPLSTIGKPLVIYEPRYRHYRIGDHMEPLDALLHLFAFR